jgi:hypothetical protein
MMITLGAHLFAKREDSRWRNIEELQAIERGVVDSKSVGETDNEPARIVGWSMVVIGAGMMCLLPINPGQRLVLCLFAVVIIGIGGVTLYIARKPKNRSES